MGNKLLKLVKAKTIESIAVGVLETPCFPATYYGGGLVRGEHGEYYPANNSTGFFVTEEAALEAAECWPNPVRMHIVGPAIKYGNNRMIFKLRPWRHSHIIQEHGIGEEGFLTSRGSFVDRALAKKIARDADQILEGKGKYAELISEDLW